MTRRNKHGGCLVFTGILFLLIIVLLLGIGIVWQGEPPIGTVSETNPAKYLQVSDYVAKHLEHDFSGFLPSTDLIDLDQALYSYTYDCAIFGLPRYAIHLQNTIDNDAAFQQECKRLAEIAQQTVSISETQVLYNAEEPMRFKEYSANYLDEKLMDGMHLFFEMALVDSETNTITYLVVKQMDNGFQIPILTEWLGIWGSRTGFLAE